MLKVIPFYAAILALLYVYLSARTIGFRRKSRVSIGDGGDQELLRAVRMHANFADICRTASGAIVACACAW